MNLAETFILIAAAIPLSLSGGLFAASLMGKTTSFLKFSPDPGYPLSLQGINLLWLGIAILMIIIARFLPMSGIFRSTIVKMKQEQSRGLKKPAWERFFLDFALLIPAAYAFIVMGGWAAIHCFSLRQPCFPLPFA
jgi:putative ABC transport system permease protein